MKCTGDRRALDSMATFDLIPLDSTPLLSSPLLSIPTEQKRREQKRREQKLVGSDGRECLRSAVLAFINTRFDVYELIHSARSPN